MSEKLLTRTEVSRSIEDAEKYKAIEVLKRVGLLIPLSDIETYHGRLAGGPGETWLVDPCFANGGNDTGNGNVNNAPTLYTSDRDVATRFAQARRRDEVRPQYRKVFKDIVDTYDEQQKQLAIDKENERLLTWWNGMDEAQKKLHKNQPEHKTLDDFDSIRWREADRIEAELTHEQRTAIWKEVAGSRTLQVHKIVSNDSDAMILDLEFKQDTIPEEDRELYREALIALAPPITEGSPLPFEYRSYASKIQSTIKNLAVYLVTLEDIPRVATLAGVPEHAVQQFSSAYNAGHVAVGSPEYLAKHILSERTELHVMEYERDGSIQKIPINIEYAKRYMQLNHIVGVRQPVFSATIGEHVDVVAFFDLTKTRTVEQHKNKRADIWDKLGPISLRLAELQKERIAGGELGELLSDYHVKPQRLIEAAKRVPGYHEIFEADAGNWEGFTLEEHTETVLRNFEENYADALPVEMLPPLRLALLAHDIGKPIAVRNGEKQKQAEYNAHLASRFFDIIGVDSKLKNILLAAVNLGAQHAFNVQVIKNGKSALREWQGFAEATLVQVVGGKPSSAEITGFMQMCSIIQICDGGAYTSMAVTRAVARGSYRNAPSFNGTFCEPIDLGRRGIALKRSGDTPAQKSQSARISKDLS